MSSDSFSLTLIRTQVSMGKTQTWDADAFIAEAIPQLSATRK